MKYRIINEEVEFDTIGDVIDWCIDDDYHEDDDEFEDWVDEKYDTYYINGYSYSPYEIINAIDDSCISELINEYCETMNDDDRERAEDELERADIGDTVEIQGYEVEVVGKDDDLNTGDFDGDEIGYLRERLMEDKANKNIEEEKQNKTEDDLMKMFQVIGG